MNDNDSIFNKYNGEKKDLKQRIKDPKYWINFILIAAFLIAAIVIVTSFKSTWNSSQVRKSMKIVWQETEWREVKTNFKDVMVKIVPVISLKVKNIGNEPLQFVDFEGVFEFVLTGKTHTSGYSKSMQNPLKPGEISEKIVLSGANGYTASSIKAFYEKLENWKKLRVKIFARTKGSPPSRIGGTYPVKQVIKGNREFLDLDSAEDENLKSSLKVDNYKSEWIYKIQKAGDVIIYPLIDLKVKNIGDTDIKKLVFSAVFSFEKSGDRKQSGYPMIKKVIKPGDLSKKITLTAEFGISVSSLQSLYDNIFEWERVKVKVLVKNMKSGYILLGEFPVDQKIRGVRVIRK